MNKNITSKSGLAKKVKVLEKENAKLKFSEIQIIDKVDNPVVSTDIKGYITNWNKGAEQLLKYSKKEALGKHISFIYPDRQEKLFMENLIRPLIEKGTLKTKVLTKRKSGENLYTNILLLLIKSVGNNEIRIIGSSADAKEYRLEDIFKKSKEELIIILNSIKDGVIVTDYKGKIIRMNPVSEQLSGWKFDQAKTQTFEKIFNIIDNKTGKKIKTSIDYITDINDNSDISLISKNGLLHRISYKATNIKGGNGKIIGAVVVFHDIMEKYILSKALQDSEGKYKTFISNFPGIVFRSDLYFKPLFFHGKVKDIKKEFKTNRFEVSFTNFQKNYEDVLNENFEIISENNDEDYTRTRIHIKNGSSANDLLGRLLPVMDIHSFIEEVPSMNDIFIAKVTNTSIGSKIPQHGAE